jgi:hypothetical protein
MTTPLTLKIGTRGSPLALYQARLIAQRLSDVSGGAVRGEIVTFSTKGDQLTTERLINSGGKGLFTREIDRAVGDGDVDIGVHSLKDVPSQLPEGQTMVAYPERADPRDGLLSVSGVSALADLPEGATVGTASLRREAQTLALRPDLKMVSFRGSVQTRINAAGRRSGNHRRCGMSRQAGTVGHRGPSRPESCPDRTGCHRRTGLSCRTRWLLPDGNGRAHAAAEPPLADAGRSPVS